MRVPSRVTLPISAAAARHLIVHRDHTHHALECGARRGGGADTRHALCSKRTHLLRT